MLDPHLFFDPIEEQSNKLLARLDRAPFDHRDFDNGVSLGTPLRVQHVVSFHRKESVRPLVARKLERFHDALMYHFGQPLPNGQ